jgi:hypothetical protein
MSIQAATGRNRFVELEKILPCIPDDEFTLNLLNLRGAAEIKNRAIKFNSGGALRLEGYEDERSNKRPLNRKF